MTSIFNLLVTSEIWPQPNVVSFHQPVHGFLHQRHIARVFEILGAVREKGGVMQNSLLISRAGHAFTDATWHARPTTENEITFESRQMS